MYQSKTEKETSRGNSYPVNNGNTETKTTDIPPHGFRYGTSAMQGFRETMEDTLFCVLESALPPQHALFGVLDGHGGSKASEFARDELFRVLSDNEDWKEYSQAVLPYLPNNSNGKEKKPATTPNPKQIQEWTRLLEKALTRSIVELDRNFFMEKYYGEEETGLSSAGSTAVMILMTPFVILCANLGDSRCVLGTSSSSAPHSVSAKPLSQDHKADLPGERERIMQAGGIVQFGRVDGELAVSRALGDFAFKQGWVSDVSIMAEYDPDDLDNAEKLLGQAKMLKVTNLPETIVHERDDLTDRFLVLACDGIWDVLSSQDCVESIANQLQQGEADLGSICEHVLDDCLQKGSQDNMTMILVLLEGGQKLIGNKM